MLLYGERIGAAVRAVVPRGDGTPEDDFPTRVQRAVFGYVRGQLLFSLIMGTSAGVVLWILGSLGIFPDGKTYALVFGALLRLRRADPVRRAGHRRAPAGAGRAVQRPPARRAVAGDRCSPALQQIEGHVVAPTVFSQALRINPLLVIFALLLGGQLYGFIGAFIALPIAPICARPSSTCAATCARAVAALARPVARRRRSAAEAPRARSAGPAWRRRRRAARRAGPSSATPTSPHRERPPGRRRSSAPGRLEGLRRAARAAARVVRRPSAASSSRSSAPTAPARRRCCRSSPARCSRAAARSSLPPATVGWVPQQPALYSKLSVAENLRLFARLEQRRRRRRRGRAHARADRPARPRRRRGRARSRAATASA